MTLAHHAVTSSTHEVFDGPLIFQERKLLEGDIPKADTIIDENVLKSALYFLKNRINKVVFVVFDLN